MIDLSYSPLLQAINNHARTCTSKIALIAGEQQVSYGELWTNILHAASFLYGMGLRHADSILLSASKELDFVYLYLGGHLLGIKNVIIDPNSNEDRKKYIISVTQPKCVFGFYEAGVHSMDYGEVNLAASVDFVQSPCLSSDIADVMFTTGTTGNPKGVLLSHLNIYASAVNINGYIGNGPTDIEVLGLPLCHSFGLGRLRCTLINGATIVILGNFANIKLFFQTIEKYNVTIFGMVPAVWNYIRKFSGTRIGRYASQIKYIEIGSAPLSLEEKEELVCLFPHTRICMHYGLTEASRAIFMEFHEYRNCLTSIGRPVSEEVSVQIRNIEGKECPVGVEGELCIKGNMVTSSYLLPEDNVDAFWGDYFRTGDYGYMDEHGLIYLTGRLKELINVGGKKVSPVEVEDAIVGLGIEDCACIGVADPKGVLGEVVKAYLVKGKSDLTIEDVANRLVGLLEDYKIPVEYEWVNEIPKTTSGKKQRLLLK